MLRQGKHGVDYKRKTLQKDGKNTACGTRLSQSIEE
jgi:hypothetical protein